MKRDELKIGSYYIGPRAGGPRYLYQVISETHILAVKSGRIRPLKPVNLIREATPEEINPPANSDSQWLKMTAELDRLRAENHELKERWAEVKHEITQLVRVVQNRST